MILTLSYRGVFRQEQYETATIEGAVTVDTACELQDKTPEEVMYAMNSMLSRLIAPGLSAAEQISRYDDTETTIYEWKRVTDATSDQAPQHQPGRRVRRGQ